MSEQIGIDKKTSKATPNEKIDKEGGKTPDNPETEVQQVKNNNEQAEIVKEGKIKQEVQEYAEFSNLEKIPNEAKSLLEKGGEMTPEELQAEMEKIDSLKETLSLSDEVVESINKAENSDEMPDTAWRKIEKASRKLKFLFALKLMTAIPDDAFAEIKDQITGEDEAKQEQVVDSKTQSDREKNAFDIGGKNPEDEEDDEILEEQEPTLEGTTFKFPRGETDLEDMKNVEEEDFEQMKTEFLNNLTNSIENEIKDSEGNLKENQINIRLEALASPEFKPNENPADLDSNKDIAKDRAEEIKTALESDDKPLSKQIKDKLDLTPEEKEKISIVTTSDSKVDFEKANPQFTDLQEGNLLSEKGEEKNIDDFKNWLENNGLNSEFTEEELQELKNVDNIQDLSSDKLKQAFSDYVYQLDPKNMEDKWADSRNVETRIEKNIKFEDVVEGADEVVNVFDNSPTGDESKESILQQYQQIAGITQQAGVETTNYTFGGEVSFDENGNAKLKPNLERIDNSSIEAEDIDGSSGGYENFGSALGEILDSKYQEYENTEDDSEGEKKLILSINTDEKLQGLEDNERKINQTDVMTQKWGDKIEKMFSASGQGFEVKNGVINFPEGWALSVSDGYTEENAKELIQNISKDLNISVEEGNSAGEQLKNLYEQAKENSEKEGLDYGNISLTELNDKIKKLKDDKGVKCGIYFNVGGETKYVEGQINEETIKELNENTNQTQQVY